jgi:pimeloyl-ACP methyl ester carboxylesterase
LEIVEAKTYFIHGITGSKHNFNAFRKYFPNSTAFDLAGFASSPKPEALYDKAFYLKFLEEKISEKGIIVGHSMGSMLAKYFALVHPELVDYLYLISYPMHKNTEALKTVVLQDPLTRGLLSDNNRTFALSFIGNWATAPLALPLTFIFRRDLYLTLWNSYRFNRRSLRGAVFNTVLKDDYHELEQIKDKMVMFVGERDKDVDKALVKPFNHHVISKMRHTFFGFENEIARLILQNEDLRLRKD